MTPLEAALVDLSRCLDELTVSWAMVGGFAVSARVEPRFTRDVDVAVAVTGDSEAEQLVQSLGSRGYVVTTTIEHEPSGRLATVRLRAPGSAPVVVDLLFASSGIEPELVEQAERLELLPGMVVPVATTSALMVLKVLARDDLSRPQDAVDLRQLSRVATPRDFSQARALARASARSCFSRSAGM